jgi:two-component system cell cycle sensor histidine kinase/response regulator CckA
MLHHRPTTSRIETSPPTRGGPSRRRRATTRAAVGPAAHDGPRFRELLAGLPLPAVILDARGRILFANRFLAELVGRSQPELVGSDAFDLNPADERRGNRAVFADGVSAGDLSPQVETKVIGADGTARTILWSVATVRDDSMGGGPGAVVEIVGVGQDVTERRAFEAQRAQLEALVETTPAATMAFDVDRTVRVWNPGAELTFGWTAEEVVGRPLPPMVRPEDAVIAADRIRRTLQGESIRGDRVIRLTKDGQERLIEIWAARMVDDSGTATGVAGQMIDVTERVAIQAEHAAAEARFQELLETVDLCTMILDPEGRIVFVNEFLVDLVGWTSAELVGRDWFGTLRPEAVRADGRTWLADVVGGAATIERRHTNEILTRSGDLRTIRWNTTLLRDLTGAVTGLASVGEDITERLAAEAGRARLAAAVMQAGDMVLIAAEDGRIEFVNPAFEAVTGYDSDEVLGRTAAEVLRSDRHPPSFYAGMEAAFRRGDSWSDTITDRRKDGSLFEVNLRISPIRDPGGAVVGFVHVSRDLTQERILEGQLRQALKMEAVGQLAGGVAHDFNNMLTAIRGYAEILQANLRDDDDGNRADLEQIVLTADRAAALTRQLLAFARKQVIEPRVLDPALVVAAIAPMLRRLLGEHIELVVDAPVGDALVRIDPNQLEQVVLNLGVNARDAMPDGGRLVISTRAIEIGGADDMPRPGVRPGPSVVLSVSDTGNGIDPTLRDRIFEPFFTTKGLGEGTGMGLATAHGIVDQAGGAITLETSIGAGTTFRVFLPRVTDSGATPLVAEPVRLAARGTETILLVEDEEAVRNFAARCLHELGYDVIEAAHGDEALAMATTIDRPIHLLLTDVSMPGMRGTELALRLAGRRPDLRVVLTSGHADASILDTALQDGATGYLPKPYSRDALAQAVRSAFD